MLRKLSGVRTLYGLAVVAAAAALAFTAAPALAGCTWVCHNCTVKQDGTATCEWCEWVCNGGGPAPAEDAS